MYPFDKGKGVFKAVIPCMKDTFLIQIKVLDFFNYDFTHTQGTS